LVIVLMLAIRTIPNTLAVPNDVAYYMITSGAGGRRAPVLDENILNGSFFEDNVCPSLGDIAGGGGVIACAFDAGATAATAEPANPAEPADAADATEPVASAQNQPDIEILQPQQPTGSARPEQGADITIDSSDGVPMAGDSCSGNNDKGSKADSSDIQPNCAEPRGAGAGTFVVTNIRYIPQTSGISDDLLGAEMLPMLAFLLLIAAAIIYWLIRRIIYRS